MLKHFWHWIARVSGNEAHVAFGEARALYMAYVSSLEKGLEQLDESDFTRAMNDSGLKRAEQLYINSRAYAEDEGRSDNVAIADYQLGLLYHLQGRFEDAQQRLKLCVDALETSISSDPSERSTLSGCYYNLGIIALRGGNPDEAEQLVKKSLEIDEADGDVNGIGMCRAALGAIKEWTPNINQVQDRQSRFGVNASQTELGNLPRNPVEVKGGNANVRNSKNSVTPVNGISSMPSSVTDSGMALGGADEDYRSIPNGVEVIWLLSYSVEANDIYLKELNQHLADGVMHRVSIQRAAFGGERAEFTSLPQIESNERLCAAVLVLEETGLDHPTYLKWAKLCLDRVAEADDFRLFIGAPMPFRSLEMYEQSVGHDGRQFIQELVQSIQFAVADDGLGSPEKSAESTEDLPQMVPGPKEVAEACRSYLLDLDAIRSMARWRALKIRTAATMGGVATLSQVVATLFLVVGAVSVFAFDSRAALPGWILSNGEIVGVFAGIMLFPLNTLPVFFLLRGLRVMHTLIHRRPDLARLFLPLMLVSFGLGFLIEFLKMPVEWVVLGLVMGGIVDHARRVGFSVRRAGISLLKCLQFSSREGLPTQWLEHGTKITEHPLLTPLFPAMRPQIFISYARRTHWSERSVAHPLHRQLASQGTVSFIDRESIGAGADWRDALNRCITDADIFITIVETETMARRWVAAELIAAVTARSVSGAPKIVVLAEPGLENLGSRDSLPIFDTVLATGSTTSDDRLPSVLKVDDSSLPRIAHGLASYDSASVFPSDWSVLLRMIVFPVVILGPLSELLGLPAAVLFFLEYGNKTNVDAVLTEWSVLAAVCIVCAYFAGFAARLLASTCFEVRRRRRQGLIVAHAITCAGFAALTLLWSVQLSALGVGWLVVLACVGWYLAELFIQTTKPYASELS